VSDTRVLTQPTMGEILERHLSRRTILRSSVSAALGGVAAGSLLSACGGSSNSNSVPPVSTPTAPAPKLGFSSVPISTADSIVVPPGYTARVLTRWGDPVSNGPEFRFDASNSAADQALQQGMHHDGIHFFPLPLGSTTSTRGLLVTNHEYVETNILHADGGNLENPTGYTREKCDKEIAAHGVSVIEVTSTNGAWSVVRPAALGRRITGATPMRIQGPAAAHPRMRTADDPTGTSVLGTLNNCGHGYTPWGTYLTCEENFNGYFSLATPPSNTQEAARYSRYGIGRTARYGWDKHYARYNLVTTPNEANRHGWVTEIDPYDATSVPVKRTALGRFSHEGATVVVGANNRVAVYSGDDNRFDYIYKFVARDNFAPANRESNRNLLDNGTLYVARFKDDGTGEWLPLTFGQNGLTPENGFADQAEVVIFARLAADRLGATPMDRAEWIAHDPRTREMFVTCTNNTARTDAQRIPSNPRANNTFGHVIRWTETGSDVAALTFAWRVLALAGDGSNTDTNLRGTINGDIYACPDGLWMDDRQVLWIQTDMSDSDMRAGRFAPFGNNMMVACDPTTGETKRFMTGPVGCEVTGVIATPDGRTLFVNIQHPGDIPKDLRDAGVTLSPANPRASSNWPDFNAAGRPRSATVVITRNDGGLIGT
jgi:uncharacterized protein